MSGFVKEFEISFVVVVIFKFFFFDGGFVIVVVDVVVVLVGVVDIVEKFERFFVKERVEGYVE